MKPTLTKITNARGSTIGHRASFGPISGSTDATPADARVSCEREVLTALERLDHGTSVHVWNGHTYVLSPTTHGWCYWLDTFGPGRYSTCGGYATMGEANTCALSHLAQNVWTHDDDDTAFVALLPEGMRREKLQYFGWQRQMRAFTAQGYTSDQARQMIADGIDVATMVTSSAVQS